MSQPVTIWYNACMRKLAVVHVPNFDTKDIDAFRKKYDSGWKIIPPHITIVSPLSEISEEQLVKHIASQVKGIKAFPIRLHGLIRTFDDCLFLHVQEGTEQIIELHNKLYSGILAPYVPTEYPFEPHITLGSFRSKEDIFDAKLFASAYAEAEEMNIDATSLFDNISLITGDGLNPAIIIKTIALEK
jgi:2'-5' RNA ligase